MSIIHKIFASDDLFSALSFGGGGDGGSRHDEVEMGAALAVCGISTTLATKAPPSPAKAVLAGIAAVSCVVAGGEYGQVITKD